MSGADPKDVRRKQSGTFDVTGDVPSTTVTMTSYGSSSEHLVRLDFNRAESVMRDWSSIGMLPKQRELLDQLKNEEQRHGVVLVGGAKQSGVTTTGYSILSQHDAYLCNIVTLEQEVIGSLEGVTHSINLMRHNYKPSSDEILKLFLLLISTMLSQPRWQQSQVVKDRSYL